MDDKSYDENLPSLMNLSTVSSKNDNEVVNKILTKKKYSDVVKRKSFISSSPSPKLFVAGTQGPVIPTIDLRSSGLKRLISAIK